MKKELDLAASSLSKGFIDVAIKVAAKHGITLIDEDFKPETKILSEDECRLLLVAVVIMLNAVTVLVVNARCIPSVKW